MIQDKKTTGMGKRSLTDLNAEGPHRGTFMTVRQMGELLGLKRTEWYWLLHKNLFETKNICGKTMVNVASFEKWYAGQIHYHKVTGEEPGQLVNAATYSIRDLTGLLGISESRVYALIKREQLETVSVDFRMRVPREAFDQWYSSQSRYCKAEEKKKENVMQKTDIAFWKTMSMRTFLNASFWMASSGLCRKTLKPFWPDRTDSTWLMS